MTSIYCGRLLNSWRLALGRISPSSSNSHISFPSNSRTLSSTHLTCLSPSQSLRRGLCLQRIFLLLPRSESKLDRLLRLLSSRLLLVTQPAPILFKWEVESHLIQHVLVLFEIATKAPCQNSHVTPIFSIHLPDLGRTTTSRMRKLFSNSLHPMTFLSAHYIKYPSRDCLRHSVKSVEILSRHLKKLLYEQYAIVEDKVYGRSYWLALIATAVRY
jgi:hypothetical protein